MTLHQQIDTICMVAWGEFGTNKILRHQHRKKIGAMFADRETSRCNLLPAPLKKQQSCRKASTGSSMNSRKLSIKHSKQLSTQNSHNRLESSHTPCFTEMHAAYRAIPSCAQCKIHPKAHPSNANVHQAVLQGHLSDHRWKGGDIPKDIC